MKKETMRLFIKQKAFSWRDRFYIKDENGNDRYYAEGEVFSWVKKLHLYDLEGKKVAYFEQKAWSWMPKYRIYRHGEFVALIRREFTFLRPKYTLEGPGWSVDGSFWAHDYAIYAQGHQIATVKKEWFTWGDSYVLDISDGWNEVLALSIVLVIDCVEEQDAAAST